MLVPRLGNRHPYLLNHFTGFHMVSYLLRWLIALLMNVSSVQSSYLWLGSPYSKLDFSFLKNITCMCVCVHACANTMACMWRYVGELMKTASLLLLQELPRWNLGLQASCQAPLPTHPSCWFLIIFNKLFKNKKN